MLDLEEIKDYISLELMNPQAAKRIIASIAKDAARLKNQPYLGVELRKKTGRDIEGRALISGNYMLIYDVDGKIAILRVIDTRVDYLRIIGNW